MKFQIKSILCLFALLIVSSCFSQEIGGNYYFKSHLSHEMTKDILKEDKNNPIKTGFRIIENKQIKVSYIEDDRVYFNFKNTDEAGELITYSIKKEDFRILTETYFNFFRGYNYGAFTVPTRMRLTKETFEFDSNLSLGANVSFRFGVRNTTEHRYTDFILGFSITKVNLTAENSILGDSTIMDNPYAQIATLSPVAITPSIGALISLSENINIGIYGGADIISSADQKSKWIYNGRPWLGIGLNILVGDSRENDGNLKN